MFRLLVNRLIFPRKQRCTKARRRRKKPQYAYIGWSALITQSWEVCAYSCENCIKTAVLCQSENVMGPIRNSHEGPRPFTNFLCLAPRHEFRLPNRLVESAEARRGTKCIRSPARDRASAPNWRFDQTQKSAASSQVYGWESKRRPGKPVYYNRGICCSPNSDRVPAARPHVG